jgi:hypothetical protein
MTATERADRRRLTRRNAYYLTVRRFWRAFPPVASQASLTLGHDLDAVATAIYHDSPSKLAHR